ncbi:bifunctional RNase H/acid phosphatase [Streptomyces sp. NA04227]|uniref:bifunctional RNase H/acid phosphatase n=1 Tax=Streptomyces sp. NA04227 TaxID=2742136 RepID=UPI00158FC90A|nr:bifunctional RNase H/acid phosphatase [Streptomyces sp. NA04227]QKW06229.1 bifunctional RNase H/acid phosphatase [Streptomyces sp. NA04227]
MNEFIVEADGGSRGNPGPAGYGAVVLDAATGQTLAEAAEYLGVATNNVAEYSGLVAGLRAAHRLDPAATVRVRMDSKLVVEQMSGRWQIKHPAMRPLAAEARAVFGPGQVSYEWIPRARNKHADRLANEAMDAGARGEQWSPATSTAELDAQDARLAAGEDAAAGPGDAAAGAAAVRTALAASANGRAAEADPDRDTTEQADVRAARNIARTGETRTAEPRPRSDHSADDQSRTADTRTPAAGWAPADLGQPATFVLLRHGETPLTPEKRFSGSGGSDPALSAVGRDQAARVAAALAERGTVEAIVSSPLARCRETAGAVADRLGLGIELEEGLRETDFGAWEGLTFGEVRERHAQDLTDWLASPEARPTGGGESFTEVADRVAAARDRLVERYAGRTVLLVTHVTPIKTLVRLALGAPAASLFRMELSAASLSAVAYYRDGNASVRLLNDTGHLR